MREGTSMNRSETLPCGKREKYRRIRDGLNTFNRIVLRIVSVGDEKRGKINLRRYFY